MLKITENDLKILNILYKLPWAESTDIALLIDEPPAHINRRLLQMSDEDLIGRATLAAGVPCCNYIKNKGMRTIGKPLRYIRKPALYKYQHDRGMIDCYIFLSLIQAKDGRPFASFGSIITERDFMSARQYSKSGTKSDGSPRIVTQDSLLGIHQPDGYVLSKALSGKTLYLAIEYERSVKSLKSNSHLLDNLDSNSLIFDQQYWFCDGTSVSNKVKKNVQDHHHAIVIDFSKVTEYLEKKKKALPFVPSFRDTREPADHIGTLLDPIPLNRLPSKKRLNLEGGEPDE